MIRIVIMSNEVSFSNNVLDGASFLQRIIELNLSNPRNLSTVSAVVDVYADCVVGLKSNQSTLE